MANAPRASTSTLLKFSSPSLTNADVLDARSGEVKYRLRSGRTPDTVLIDHGGFVGYKSTCVIRLTSILCDANDKELGRVSWDADGRPIRMWLTGGDPSYGRAGTLLPGLCGEEEGNPRVIGGWEVQTSLQATWRAHVEGAAMFALNDSSRMLALYSPNMVRASDGAMSSADVTGGQSGSGFLRLWVAPVDVIEAVLTAIVTEASRRFVFELGPLDPTPVRASAPPKGRRPSIVGRFSGLMRRSNSDSSESGLSSSSSSRNAA
ncbi:hypothetical protein PENSPDRAFT_672226 [Peniophora sp. CONT]|nr:hypothetical protein PENSPDRAFT_672226 [Peniophora sp. CONT]